MSLRWKIITVVAVLLVFGTVGVYPIAASRFGLPMPQWLRDKALKLGLDLKGGVHLVLRVQTEDALNLQTLTEMERLRELLSTAAVKTGNISQAGTTAFRVEGVAPEQDGPFRQAAAEVEANFDRSASVGGAYTFTLKPNVQITLRDEAVVQARQTINGA